MAKILLLLSFLFPLFLFYNLVKKSHSEIIQQEIVWMQDFQSKNHFFYDSNNLPPKNHYIFTSDNFLAFLNNHGQIIYKRTIKDGLLAATSQCCYLLFKERNSLQDANAGKKNSEQYPLLFTKNGERLFKFQQKGYGLLSPDGNIVIFISTDGSTISMYDRNGKRYIKDLFVNTLITDISFSEYNNSFAIGGVNGKTIVINHQGKIVFEKELNNHKYPVIKSLSLSYTSDWLAILSGHEEEKLYLLKKTNNNKNYEQKWTQPTHKNRLKNIILRIDEKNNALFEQIKNGVLRRSLKNGKITGSFTFENMEEADYMLLDFLPPLKQVKKKNDREDLIAISAVKGNTSRIALFKFNSLVAIWERTFPYPILNIKLSYQHGYHYLLFQTNKKVIYYRMR